MRRLAALTILALAVSACGLSRESRIGATLEKAGMKPRLAHCMAHKLDEKLSDDQLAELARAMKATDDGDRLNARRLAERLAAVDDPDVVGTVSRAALGCTILG